MFLGQAEFGVDLRELERRVIASQPQVETPTGTMPPLKTVRTVQTPVQAGFDVGQLTYVFMFGGAAILLLLFFGGKRRRA